MPMLDTLKPALDLGASLSATIQVVLVIVSLWLVLRQLRQNAELAWAANAQALVEMASPCASPSKV